MEDNNNEQQVANVVDRINVYFIFNFLSDQLYI